ncbi:CD224 [Mytilus edulis]|uniref:GGT1_5 n=1 Tax=Mytilus edulis TaxID=6550 RepID=A0A8S3T371_MYTED|nr:CD224 [Mytilus edulis]
MLIVSTFLICSLIIALGVVLGLKIYKDDNQNKNTICEGHYRYAAVASDAGPPCSTIGTDMMARRGGSVVDASIATLLCQCIHNFHSCGIGGGFFMTVYERSKRAAYTILAREMAPREANETMYVGRSSTEGGLAVGIPGEIRGLWEAHQVGGKLPWKDLLQPTIKLLKEGYTVGIPVAIAMAAQTEVVKRQQGLKDLITNPQTGKFYLMKALMLFIMGTLTKDIVADIRDAGGIITEEDLAGYTAPTKDPLVIKLNKNETIYSSILPSSGVVYQFILNILDGYKLSTDSVSTKEKEILTWHRIIEAFKFAYAKRTSLGDGDAEDDAFRRELDELVQNMTSETYAEDIRSQISDSQTFGTNYYGPTFYDDVTTGTAHLSVLAPNGDAVSVTSTINLYFGSKVVGSRTGIIFNNEMDDFSTPNTVNSFGIPASPANFIKPGKRPLSSMCPSIVVNSDGMVNIVVGASGGSKITTSTALVTALTQWLGMGIKEAIDHRRLHHQLLPAHIDVEKGFPQYILDGLIRLGHNITLKDSAGCVVQGILQQQEGVVTANSDYRKHGHPDGY